MTGRRARAAMLAALFAGGCVTGSYSHVSVNEPVSAERLEALRPGTDTLATCLAALGAPNRVFEYRVQPDRTSGAALLWVWRDAAGWGIQVSARFEDASGSFQYDKLATDLPGCMLWFDEHLVLERWRRGLIGDILIHRQRPYPALDDPPAGR